MSKKNKYTVYCLDKDKKRKTVTIMANDKVEAKKQALENHPKNEVTAAFSPEEVKAYSV